MTIDYEKFIGQLRAPEAEALREKLQMFLLRFRQDAHTVPTQRKMVSNFLQGIYQDSDNHIAFLDKNQSFDEENIKEGWEKLVMTKIFDIVFDGVNGEEKRASRELTKKINTYSWIEERHLDLQINFSLSLEVVQAELLRINGFKAPRDKLVILQNVMQLIVELIKKRTNGEINSSNDAVLPTLILTIVRANPPNMISNIKYITRFRSSSDMEAGSNQFCMTSMMSAISFIYELTSKSLTLSDEERLKWCEILTRPFENHNLNATRDEIKNFTDQVTGFFGELMKEVKSTAIEVTSSFQNLDSQSPASPFSPSSGVPTKPPRMRPTDNAAADLAAQEQEDLELAIAMSLSEAQAEKNLMNLDSYSPISALSPHNDDEEEEELKRTVKK